MASNNVKHDAGRELLVLGIVRRQALSAYAIDRAVRQHSPLYRPLGQGNVYHLVERLFDDGYLTGRREAAERGPRKTKAVFALSPQGEKHFLQLLRRVILDVQCADSTLEVAVVLLGQLARDRARDLLDKRDEELQAM